MTGTAASPHDPPVNAWHEEIMSTGIGQHFVAMPLRLKHLRHALSWYEAAHGWQFKIAPIPDSTAVRVWRVR